jgi:hypothetical protein
MGRKEIFGYSQSNTAVCCLNLFGELTMSATFETRDRQAKSMIGKYALVCAVVGMAPLSSPVLAAIDGKMVWDLREIYDARIHVIDILIVVVIATFVGHLLCDFILSTLAVVTLGMTLVVKGGTAFVVTRVAGIYAAKVFRDKALSFGS